MNSVVRFIAGGSLFAIALVFGIWMNHIGVVNMTHTFVVNFQNGTTPTSDYIGTKKEIVALMKANDKYTISIETHTGTRGPDVSNMELSERRRDFMIKEFRAFKDRVSGEAFGETQPVPRTAHETDTLWQKRLNRAEITVEVGG